MIFLTLEQVLRFHAMVLVQDGGADGVRDIGRLQAAVATQRQIVFGKELYPDVATKAAAMIRGIVGDHPFVDGNKRTAMLTGLTLIELNGHTVSIKACELEDFAAEAATRQLGVEDITTWLNRHIKE